MSAQVFGYFHKQTDTVLANTAARPKDEVTECTCPTGERRCWVASTGTRLDIQPLGSGPGENRPLACVLSICIAPVCHPSVECFSRPPASQTVFEDRLRSAAIRATDTSRERQLIDLASMRSMSVFTR
jgi:hypothetical protein